jgi:hypothetical protein
LESRQVGNRRLGVGERDVGVAKHLEEVVQPRLLERHDRRHRTEDVADGRERERPVDLHGQLACGIARGCCRAAAPLPAASALRAAPALGGNGLIHRRRRQRQRGGNRGRRQHRHAHAR